MGRRRRSLGERHFFYADLRQVNNASDAGTRGMGTRMDGLLSLSGGRRGGMEGYFFIRGRPGFIGPALNRNFVTLSRTSVVNSLLRCYFEI